MMEEAKKTNLKGELAKQAYGKYCAPSLKPNETENPPESVFRLERKLDKYNHIMELMRTCLALFTVTLQIVILLKLFNLI
jgi:hypothetical protein